MEKAFIILKLFLLSPRRWIDTCEAPKSPGILPLYRRTGNWLLKQLLSELLHTSLWLSRTSQIGVLNFLRGLNRSQWKCKRLSGEWGPHNGPAVTRPPADIMSRVPAAVIHKPSGFENSKKPGGIFILLCGKIYSFQTSCILSQKIILAAFGF